VGPWTGTTNGCKTSTVIIKITDQCPVSGNNQWCSGDITHFDLSQSAFAAIADPTMGVIKTQIRRTACGYTTPIRILQTTGVSIWWIKFWLLDVADYGGVSKVEIQNSGSSTWNTMTRPDGDDGWAFSATGNGFVVPLSVRVTDDNGAVQTLTGVITKIGDNLISASTVNYKNPAGTASETVSSPKDDFMKQNIYIVIAVILIAILLVALFLVLRNRARSRGTTMSGYIRESIAPQKAGSSEDLALAPKSFQPISSQSDLGSPSSPTSQEGVPTNFDELKAEPASPEPEPASSEPEPAAPISPSEWETRKDESGQPYYYNNSTGVSQWETPDSLQTQTA